MGYRVGGEEGSAHRHTHRLKMNGQGGGSGWLAGEEVERKIASELHTGVQDNSCRVTSPSGSLSEILSNRFKKPSRYCVMCLWEAQWSGMVVIRGAWRTCSVFQGWEEAGSPCLPNNTWSLPIHVSPSRFHRIRNLSYPLGILVAPTLWQRREKEKSSVMLPQDTLRCQTVIVVEYRVWVFSQQGCLE